jgi:hypothetical protein
MKFSAVAATGEQVPSRLPRYGKRSRTLRDGLLLLCCGLIAGGVPIAATAGPFERGMGWAPSVQDQRSRPGPQREAERPAPQRDMRVPGDADRGRMNPDERRQLRRDIQDAGREIYRPAQPERRDARRSGRR